jgi:hypothetical protein
MTQNANNVPRRHAAGLAFVVAAALVVAAAAASLAAAAAAATATAPKPTAPPTVEGKFQVGETLGASTGTWANRPTEYSYAWLRCNSSGGGCAAISGATGKRYKLAKADIDHTIRVAVTAQNPDGKATARSRPSPLVSDSEAPRNHTRPTISGTAQVGESLTVSTGSWTGGVRSYAFQWQRCDRLGNNCVDVPGATAKSYGVRTADVGHTLRVEVTARNAAGKTTVNTDRSEVVAPMSGTTTTVTTTEAGNQPPSLRFLSLKVRRNRVYVRLRVCDDSPGRIRITTRDQMNRRLAKTRHFSVSVVVCSVRSRSWSLVKRFRVHNRRFVVSVRASDASGRLSRLVSRSVVLR